MLPRVPFWEAIEGDDYKLAIGRTCASALTQFFDSWGEMPDDEVLALAHQQMSHFVNEKK